MSKLSLTLYTFSITGSVAGLFLTVITQKCGQTFRVIVRTLVIIISLWLERDMGT